MRPLFLKNQKIKNYTRIIPLIFGGFLNFSILNKGQKNKVFIS